MRLGLTFDCAFALCALGGVALLGELPALVAWVPSDDALLVGLLIFFSCLAGMFCLLYTSPSPRDS